MPPERIVDPRPRTILRVLGWRCSWPGAAVSITRSVVSIVAAIVTIVFLTIFMLLEGRAWMDRIYGCSPSARRRAGGRSGTTFLDLIPLAGATLAGILGALAAIPVAGAIGVILRDPFAHRRGRGVETPPGFT